MAKTRTTQPSLSPTLADVSKQAGVSTATVSRCLNSPSQVSASTRDRVMAAVKELGYAPNFGAQALAAKRTNTFGAIVPTMENAIFARGLQALQEELAQHGITLLVASSSYDPDVEEKQIRNLVARGADALFLIGHTRTAESYEFLEKRQIPHVVAWVYDEAEPRVSVGFDNRKAMKSLALEVLKQGHRKLALITAKRDRNDRARQRYEGAMDAVAEFGLNALDLDLIETTYSIANGGDAFERLMRAETPPTAVMCGNDVLAAGALSRAHRMGVDVPGDVSITGFDDIEIAEIVTPRLTTVHVPHRNMGKHAATTLIAMRNDPSLGESVELEATLRLRGSLGPAPQKTA
ncbi:LacI family DNA-binding transcriptional regulator [Cognatishimia sp.]|uniref:LacI family DNA-binding transcriptional regulator n=1 Tax=Cognatishimia sp. TaxID=2211648 RepID=UPI0035198141|nr:LacI family DNA-binding transcriptional regulator [Cognatishimia sp.]